MYYITATIALILLSINEFFFIVTFRKDSFLLKIPIITKKLLLYRSLFFGSGLLAFILLISSLIGLSTFSPLPELLQAQQQLTGLHTSGIVIDSSLIKLVGYERLANTDRYYYVYFGKDESLQTLTSLAYTIRNRVCKRSCTINLYDQEDAYIIDKERETIKGNNVMEQWNIKYYVYVANHFLGYLPPQTAVNFNYYPMKDAYYKSLLKK